MSYDPKARRKTPLALKLTNEIRRDGPMPVADFMRHCLWDQQFGYYATRLPLGQAGDFITAPEISQTFGELIGLWSAVVWRDQMGAPSAFTLAELGPGRGTLLRDALRATAKVPAFHAGLKCHLVEASQPLIAQQRATLAQCGVPLVWSDAIDAVDSPAVIVANEFFDALPVAQRVRSGDQYLERCVVVDGVGELAFSTDADDQIRETIDTGAVLEQLGRLAGVAPVAMLIIDYGHEAAGLGDTLQAVRNHAHEHPLTSPGEADLSAQVDFAAIANAARKAGLAVDGPITQAEFLGRLGIVERAHKLMAANPSRAAEIESGVARLLAPDSMGTRFKVLGLRSPALPTLPGFEPATGKANRT